MESLQKHRMPSHEAAPLCLSLTRVAVSEDGEQSSSRTSIVAHQTDQPLRLQGQGIRMFTIPGMVEIAHVAETLIAHAGTEILEDETPMRIRLAPESLGSVVMALRIAAPGRACLEIDSPIVRACVASQIPAILHGFEKKGIHVEAIEMVERCAFNWFAAADDSAAGNDDRHGDDNGPVRF